MDARFADAGAATPADVAPVLAWYPEADYPRAGKRLAAIITDYMFACPTRRAARAAAEVYGAPVHRYEFSFLPDGWRDMAALGNYHASELVFVWGVNGTFLDPLLGGAVHPMDAVTQQVDDSFTLYWGSFVNSGSPNGADELGVAEAAAAECEWNGEYGYCAPVQLCEETTERFFSDAAAAAAAPRCAPRAAGPLFTWPQFVPESAGGDERYAVLNASVPSEGARYHAAVCDFWDAFLPDV